MKRLRDGGHIPTRKEVLIGLDAPDDAAVVQGIGVDMVSVHTVDFFRENPTNHPDFVVSSRRKLHVNVYMHVPPTCKKIQGITLPNRRNYMYSTSFFFFK